MPVANARDLRALCRPPYGVPVVFAGVATYSDDGSLVCGLYDAPGQSVLSTSGFGGVISDKPTLRLPYNAFNPMPRYHDVITVVDIDANTSTEYQVAEPTPEDDGGFLVYELQATA